MQEITAKEISATEVLDRMLRIAEKSFSLARLVLAGEFSFEDLTENPYCNAPS